MYDDGHGHCFSCGKTHQSNNRSKESSSTKKKSKRELIEFGRYQDLVTRGISEETCQKFGYFVGKDSKGKTVQVAPYRDRSGRVIAQKVRGPNKQFYTTGDFTGVTLFGQHLWRKGGKRIVVTEGEIDALAAYQMLGNWPVVSIPNGAQSAAKAIKENIEFLETYEKVIFCFDNDKAGQDAVQECLGILTPGRAAYMQLPLKDAGEMLEEGLVKEFVQAFWEAQEYRPDGIRSLADIRDDVLAPVEMGLPWFIDSLTKATYGRRMGETYALGAGTGVGKTDFLTQQIQYDVQVLKERVGLFMLEQNPKETVKRIAGKIAGKRFHVPDGSWEQDELMQVVDELVKDDRIVLYDNFGATEWDVIKGTIQYLAMSQGIRIFYLDHLTALAAAEDDEKKGLERIMAEMAMLAKSLNIIIHFVSHLSTPDGKPHEEGGRVMIKHFKGSRAIGFWAHFMFGMERNQQSEDEEERGRTTFRILKDRYTGDATGQVIYLGYDRENGRLFETSAPDDDSVSMLDDNSDF